MGDVDDDTPKHRSTPSIGSVDECAADDHPIEQVRLTVSSYDDPTLPTLTFRTWVIGLISCILLSFVNQFFSYRQNPLSIGSLSVQIVALPLGKLMAATLPKKSFKVPLTGWSFTMNPGPFNLKEHVLITIFANAGAGGVYGLYILSAVKVYYHRKINALASFLLAQTTQLLGYGWAGIFRKYLVDSPYIWWPENLIQVSLFRTFHDKEARQRRELSRMQFFLLVFVSSFVYYLVPGYLFPSISAISLVCLLKKDSIFSQQIGSGLHGLGIGSFTLDWATISYLGSPLASPAFAILNTLTGFALVVYVALPILYYNNYFEARRFPMISSHTFDYQGHSYNISRILNQETFDINIPAYDSYSKLYLSVFFAVSYGLGFATLTATLSHVALFHGKSIWEMWKKTGEALKDNYAKDVHTRLVKQNYKEVPNWWFYMILFLTFLLALWTCEGFGKQIQLPWWGLLLACLIALTFTLPIGIIRGTTNQEPGLNIITELVIGYLYPGRPLANVSFKTYGYISMSQALTFLSDLKLGHYMKIPPRSMFIAQLAGTLVASTVYFATAWWLLTSIDHICDVSHLPDGSPWTCPSDEVFYNASIIWGIIGPGRMFSSLGNYGSMNWFFLIGFIGPVVVWGLRKMFPEKKWLAYINLPLLFGATQSMPPARSVNYLSWIAIGLFFNLYIYSRYKRWWARHTYVLSAALDAGTAFLGVFLFVTLQYKDIDGPEWWGLDTGDHCSLASCPTVPGVVAPGCPLL